MEKFSSKSEYYLIDGLSESEGVEVVEPTLDEIRDHLFCGNCGRPFPKVGPIDLQTSANLSWKPTLAGFSEPSVGVISDIMIKAIGKELCTQEFWLGKVYGIQGKLLKGIKTFHTKTKRLLLRGAEHSSCFCCEACNRHLYMPLPLESQSLRASVKLEKEIYQTWNGQLVVNKSLFNKIMNLLPSKGYFLQLPAVETLSDGGIECPDFV